MKKIPKQMKSTRSSKEIGLSEDLIEMSTCLEKTSESIKDIDYIINQLLKNPLPNACPFNDFKDLCNLSHEGINCHRLKTRKNLLETKMIKVFGLARGRSGYSFVDVHDDKELNRIKELYPIVYGKSIVPKTKLLGKEFAKGIVVKVVEKILVNWANCGHETNTNHQGNL